ncbi:MAG: electron transport complex subunit E [Gammaproteobacteria bacterium]|nr:electron transport complex subunit E [Gammaproteobacteria bacterium]
MSATPREIIADGFWHNNPGIVQLLGLCPLLAVSGTLVNGLGLGIATTLVLLGSNVAVSAIRDIVRPEVRIPVFVLIIASLVTTVELVMNAFFHDLYRVLGIFIPLIVTNCAIIGRAEAFASRNNIARSALDGIAMGLGFTAVLIILGGMREIIGKGTLFDGAEMLFGDVARDWSIPVLGSDYPGFLLAVLPPGAFLGLGLLIALKNDIDRRIAERATARKRAERESAEPTIA